MISQTQTQQEQQQQQMLMYFDMVLLDFDNEIEIQKLITKIKKVKVLPKLPKQK